MEDGGGGVGNGGAMRSGDMQGTEWIDACFTSGSEIRPNEAVPPQPERAAVWGVVKAVVGHCAGTC